ncbi:glycosyl hydrolase family 18 protein [Bariatricus massiliensis]|uniref:LysM peptidoglycan-binding domain-containing protein n=1 Tax=Bariatricus massiliensis TaxID=1745713 RepID=A0ABS8DI45_9FIRM|nr:glycosyl hydrolase family 18 protein [Bariatricus massiliensis]MCB7304611.1 LysM peptidoglycan-binding domain-containing protein [Bariatricus massiliensis]MCB7374762.1 LysM peptidoglycan-binding domain-containing protein [Bariatricus massiliensis]MCB7388111.1 LysM peptidoglycan-binding domain-containing protein [Bariatricus massiliensis]MCB7411927.1 LysM peptidoglycan-binding domain-containing protein [Bariatricus massiliensis]MCQ5254282.1 glycosyl hydrolase family 18 protein [Bariatricus m
MEIYVVKPGDNIYSIARRFGVSPIRLAYDNQITSQDFLVTGQALLILFPETIHTVEAGETLAQVAGQYGIEEKQILRNNPFLIDQTYLIAGQQVVIAFEEGEKTAMEVIGYAYPFIARYILREALLYIEKLLIFSYGFTSAGELIPPLANEEWLIEEARRFQVSPILVLTPFTETGGFNNQLVKEVSEDRTMQEQLIANLLSVVEEKGYDGVDVDFEYILPEDRVGYADFVGRLRTAMNETGRSVSVALAPKISADQPGLLYEGMDYRLLGENADRVFLMTYEWGYTYGPPMAVAPINKVRQVLDYAVTEIPVEKIIMGIPNYGYDWQLPYERGVTRAELIGNVEAVRIAAQNGAEIQFDETAQSPYFTYWAEGRQHEVWFEDVRSMQVKIDTAVSYGFKGFGYWNLMRPFRANWLLVNSKISL